MFKITKLNIASFAVLAAGWIVARIEQRKNIEEAVEKYMDEVVFKTPENDASDND